MTECRSCGGGIERDFRYCPWCGLPQRLKLTEFFAAHPMIEELRGRRALRVSRYFGVDESERHVRFSVWSDAGVERTRVEAAVSISDEEAERLARFLAARPPSEPEETQPRLGAADPA